tara:strand:- start:25049 stop:26197 length:1149 start_codon:yes stop_codon:yes gene_type:complete
MLSKYPKILVISAWYPNSLHEAEGDFIKHQARLMYEQGLDIKVFHASMSVRFLLKGTFTKKVFKKEIGLNEYVMEMPFWPRNNAWGIKKWANRYKNEVIKHCNHYGWPDMIHAHTYLGGYVASLIREEKETPFIMTLHESHIVSNKVPGYHKDLLERSSSSAKAVIAVGDKLAKALKKHIKINPIVFPNYIDFNKFNLAKEKFENFTFVFIGELIPRKRVNILIAAFEQLWQKNENIQLNIIGDGPLLPSLKKQARSLGSSSMVRFTGRLNQEDVASHLGKCHCLVLPSDTETFGIVLAEALASGVPFISTRSGVTEKWFKNQACLFIGQTTQDLLHALYNMMQNQASLDPKEIRRFAKAQFSSEVVIERYKELYLTLIGKS